MCVECSQWIILPGVNTFLNKETFPIQEALVAGQKSDNSATLPLPRHTGRTTRPGNTRKRGIAMVLTRDFRETIRARAKRDPEYREAMLTEAVESFLSGDVEVGSSCRWYWGP